MSSILDALKKLEKETPRQDYPRAHARADRKVFTPKRTIGSIGAVCVCVGAIGIAAYFWSTPEKMPEPFTGDVVPAPKPEATLDDPEKPSASPHKALFPAPSASQNSKSTVTAGNPEIISLGGKTIIKPKSPEDTHSTAEVTPQEKEPAAALKKTRQETQVVDKAFKKPESQPYTEETDNSDSINDLPKKAFTPKKKPLPMDRLESVGFKIQAISWREPREERLVVISNQVLREGDDIQGYQISHINPDDIVLRRGDKEYRLDFRSKGWP